MKRQSIKFEFVEFVPEAPAEGVLYISIRYATATHRCCCGCGVEVATPLSPSDWKLIFDGASVSLDPSIGNWSLICKSHYIIERNKVIWARKYSLGEIEEAREEDERALERRLESSADGRRRKKRRWW